MSGRRETLRQYQAIWNGEQPLDALDDLVTPDSWATSVHVTAT